MKLTLKKMAFGALIASALIAVDCGFEASAAGVTIPGQQNYRSSYKPTKKRTIRSIGYVGDYSDIACHTWLTADDVYYLSATELRILRNTIYARHGRKFKDAKLRNYFNQFSWYNPTKAEVSPSELTETEKHNIELIKRFE